MWTVQQIQAGAVYVGLFGVAGVIFILTVPNLKHRSPLARMLSVWLMISAASLLYFLAMWILVARVYHTV